MAILPNEAYRFNMIPIELPMAFLTELEQKISQLMGKDRRTQIANLEKGEWSWRNQPS